MPPDAVTLERKRELRAQLRAARRARPQEERERAGVELARLVLGLPEVEGGSVIAAYVSMTYEPPTDPLLAALVASGRRVLLPELLPDRDLDWREFGGDAALLGLASICSADVIVVPALAVDRRGHRLGQGGGSYDRALARVRPDVPVVALLFDGELLDEVPSQAHDRSVTTAVLPSGVVAGLA